MRIFRDLEGMRETSVKCGQPADAGEECLELALDSPRRHVDLQARRSKCTDKREETGGKKKVAKKPEE